MTTTRRAVLAAGPLSLLSAAPAQSASATRRQPLAVSTYSFWHFKTERYSIEKVIEHAAAIGFDPATILTYLTTNLVLGHDRNIITVVNEYIPNCHFLSLCLTFRWREIHHRWGGSFLPSPFITIPRLARVCTFPDFFLRYYLTISLMSLMSSSTLSSLVVRLAIAFSKVRRSAS